jgi:hypothetical protein
MFVRKLSIREPGELLWDIEEIADYREWPWTRRVWEPPSPLIVTDDQNCGKRTQENKSSGNGWHGKW